MLQLTGPHRQARLRRLAQPARRVSHVLDPIQFGFIAQHPPQIVLLLVGQLGQLPHQGGHRPRRQQIIGGALADFLRQQGAGGGGEIVGEAPHLFTGDLLALIGGLADQLLHLWIGLGGLEESPLGEIVDAGELQHPLTHQVIGGVGQLDQGVGAGLADLPLPQPLQKTRTPALTAALFAIAYRPEDAPTADFGLQIEAIADSPGLLQPGQEFHRADRVAVGIWQFQAQPRELQGGGDHGGSQQREELAIVPWPSPCKGDHS